MMAHTYNTSPKVEQLIMEASRLELDKSSFTKVKVDDASSIDIYEIPWNNAWNTLVSEAVNESVRTVRFPLEKTYANQLKKPLWKEGATELWPFTAKAMELRSGGIRASASYSSLVIPLIMSEQSDKVAFLRVQDEETDTGNTAKIRWEDLEEWKPAFYVFKGHENIHTLRHPIRFIWVRFTKPETEVQPQLAKNSPLS